MYWYEALVLVGIGALAGSINTLGGNGSALTLTLLMDFIGLPPNVANSTNRVGILFQAVISTSIFYKKGKLDIPRAIPFTIPMTIGAIAGAFTSIYIEPNLLRYFIGGVMVVLLLAMVFKPEKWLQETRQQKPVALWKAVPLALVLGFYGGLIQMGMGVFLLAALVLGAGYSLSFANGIKLFSVTSYTIVIMFIFAWSGDIRWAYGLTMAIGQGVGAWAASRFAIHHPRANLYTHRLLIVIIIYGIMSSFGLDKILYKALLVL